MVNATFRSRHIVMGQYLGFTILVLASLPSFLGDLVLPRAWIGLLGLVPIGADQQRITKKVIDSAIREVKTSAAPRIKSSLLKVKRISEADFSLIEQ
jgi:cadmium resistance protein CadD (predicted permease)